MKLTLKACRVNVNATAKVMADVCGVKVDTIYNWENGRSSPRASQVPVILKFFADRGFPVTIDEIIF